MQAYAPDRNRTVTLEVAIAAPCEVRTVARVLRGERVRGHVDARIRCGLAARGIVVPPSAAPDLGSTMLDLRASR